MALLIQKYGGSSIPTPARIRAVARRIAASHREGHDVVVVMSAMGGVTDQLLAQARDISTAPAARELDALLATGEQASNALTAMALRDLGVEARSLTGWQASILTSPDHGRAAVTDVRPHRVRDALDHGVIPLVTGFQGLDPGDADITTLGRGGSDTTAVALAAALEADACEIYTDVAGVYTADPKVVPEARPLARLTHRHMYEMAAGGAKVLALPSVEHARQHGVTLHIRSSYDDSPGTVVSETASGADYSGPGPRVIAVTHDPHGTRTSLPGPLGPTATALLSIVTPAPAFAGPTRPYAHPWHTARQGAFPEEDIATASLVGSGLCAHPETAATLDGALTRAGIAYAPLTVTDTRITVMCHPAALDDTVRVLHAAFLTATPEPPVARRGGRLAVRS
ncbi:aspartate kinase [Streptomyces sp. NPDC047990]|uniref:aspartate kinase n=1 Tax=Streptomyces sp. NPDC047990 TaxID=3365496 RepID=UPI0037171BD0